jgi:plastocyanin
MPGGIFMKSFFVGLALASLVGCGGGGSGATSPNTNQPVNTTPPADGISVTNDAFTPSTKTITVGGAVQWAWNSCGGDGYGGQTCVSHSVTFDDGSGSLTQDHGTFSKTFNTAGTYNYHCAIHGAAMTGKITVQ